jgi:hypothetical protein
LAAASGESTRFLFCLFILLFIPQKGQMSQLKERSLQPLPLLSRAFAAVVADTLASCNQPRWCCDIGAVAMLRRRGRKCAFTVEVNIEEMKIAVSKLKVRDRVVALTLKRRKKNKAISRNAVITNSIAIWKEQLSFSATLFFRHGKAQKKTYTLVVKTAPGKKFVAAFKFNASEFLNASEGSIKLVAKKCADKTATLSLKIKCVGTLPEGKKQITSVQTHEAAVLAQVQKEPAEPNQATQNPFGAAKVPAADPSSRQSACNPFSQSSSGVSASPSVSASNPFSGSPTNNAPEGKVAPPQASGTNAADDAEETEQGNTKETDERNFPTRRASAEDRRGLALFQLVQAAKEEDMKAGAAAASQDAHHQEEQVLPAELVDLNTAIKKWMDQVYIFLAAAKLQNCKISKTLCIYI